MTQSSESGSESEEPSSDYNTSDEEEYENDVKSEENKDIPLFMRLEQEVSDGRSRSRETTYIQRKLKKQKKDKTNVILNNKVDKKKKSKNAPAEMPSNKPVRRLRDNVAATSQKKFRDPRFDELSGRLNIDKFYQSNKFLDEYQESEIETLQKRIKKTKGVETKSILKEELMRSKQELTERRRSQKVSEKIQQVKKDELEKVKKGKTPFYLKKSAQKELALEARYEELKSSGKLQSFLNKKRKRNSNKDHRKIPMPRKNE